jgi:stage III sporulation protein AD
MDIFKIIGIGFITLFATIILREYKKEYVVYVLIIGGILIMINSIELINSIITFIDEFASKTEYQSFIKLLLKITGIAIITEYAVCICRDSGENSIATKIDFGSKVIIISLSIPVISQTMESLLELLP